MITVIFCSTFLKRSFFCILFLFRKILMSSFFEKIIWNFLKNLYYN
ncbi:hypothetical protein HMPREF1871_00885 [Gemelliphila asaccharolytica]|uniref:Uncharacterized protein n=1 Tax=Gemelliphila asaccharolytica TaxID=502393 RepID=A0ABR5TLA4_9BACL|nr:hypothetical protein HMPREF1871_00885 [Gemella asaccharolytica]